jgi:hypothetical protein
MNSPIVRDRTTLLAQAAEAPAPALLRPIIGTAGLQPRDVELYHAVVLTEIGRLHGTRIRSLMTAEGYTAYDNMIIVAKALNGGTEQIKKTLPRFDVAKYNAVIKANAKAIHDKLERARFAEGAHRAWLDLESSFENLIIRTPSL